MKNKKRTKTKNSKTPLKSAISGEFWSEWRDSNARPLAPKASALPLGYTRIYFSCGRSCGQTCGRSSNFREKPSGEKSQKPSVHAAFRVRCIRRAEECVHAPKPPALPTALHPDIEFVPAGCYNTSIKRCFAGRGAPRRSPSYHTAAGMCNPFSKNCPADAAGRSKE